MIMFEKMPILQTFQDFPLGQKKNICLFLVTRPYLFFPADPKLFFPISEKNKLEKNTNSSKTKKINQKKIKSVAKLMWREQKKIKNKKFLPTYPTYFFQPCHQKQTLGFWFFLA